MTTVLERHLQQQRARRTAADALATKAEKLLELHRKHIGMGYLVNEVFELDAAVREYREVTK